jgi:hypothetical protein
MSDISISRNSSRQEMRAQVKHPNIELEKFETQVPSSIMVGENMPFDGFKINDGRIRLKRAMLTWKSCCFRWQFRLLNPLRRI